MICTTEHNLQVYRTYTHRNIVCVHNMLSIYLMFFFLFQIYSRNVRTYIKLKRTRELAACPGIQIYELSDNRLRGFHTYYI